MTRSFGTVGLMTLMLAAGCADVVLGTGDGKDALHSSSGQGGSNTGAGGAASTMSEIPSYVPGTLGCAHRDPDFAPVEVWSGYVEAETFGSGSDLVELRLTQAGPGPIAGRIIFGEGPFRYPRVEEGAGGSAGGVFIEGFDYTLVGDSRREGDRLVAVAAQREVWCEFCEAQVSFEHQPEAEYTCDPRPLFGAVPNDAHFLACNTPWSSSWGACSCGPEGCSATGFGDGAEPERSFVLDVVTSGDTAVGTLYMHVGALMDATIHLQRVE